MMQMEELELPAVTTVALNIASPTPNQTARIRQTIDRPKIHGLMLLLLLDSDAPLIVDQPEDDLDNRFVTEGIVPKMRDEKRRRQFVFSSHNANIPVLGDAELIVGMTASGSGDDATSRAVIDPRQWVPLTLERYENW